MAYNIIADPNCISLWRFEAGSMLTDAKGNNDLTYSNPAWQPLEDTIVYKEGDCSAKWNEGDEEAYIIDDGDLSADFPLKDGGGKTTFSWVAWIYPHVEGDDHWLFGKMSLSYDFETLLFINRYPSPTWGVYASGNETVSDIAAVDDVWQHVAVTYDGATDQLTIRVYNDSTKVTDSYQVTLSGGDVIVTGSQPWVVGPYYDLDWRIDELAVFDDVLTPAEIDEIRAGTFGEGGGGEEQTTGDGGGISTFFLGCPF